MINTENITVNKQSSIKIAGTSNIYFDPFGIEMACGDADVIFITHEHYDHFDPDSIEKIKKESTVLVAPVSIKKQILAKSGIAEEKCLFMEPDTSISINAGTKADADIKVEAIPSYNKLKPFHPKFKGYLGYIVTMDGIRYYVAGDTDVNEDNLKVECDVALVPVGGTYTMDYKHAAELIACIQPAVAIPTHYGSEVGKPENGSEFAATIKEKGCKIEVVLKIGQKN